MLAYHPYEVLKCIGAFWLFFLAVGFTAYQVNARRPAKDSKKRNYHPFAILMVPFALLFFAPLAIVLFVITAILYAGFILLFAIMLVGLRRPFLFVWWRKFATFVGEPILAISTYLIMLPFRLINPRPVQRPAAYGNL